MTAHIRLMGMFAFAVLVLSGCGGGGSSPPAAVTTPTVASHVFRFTVRHVGDKYSTTETQTTNTGQVSVSTRNFLVTAADTAGDTTFSISNATTGAAISSEAIVVAAAGGGTETQYQPSGAFISSETVDPIKADIDEMRSSTENCTYSNGRDLVPPNTAVGTTWSSNGVLQCTDTGNVINGAPYITSGTYSGNGVVLSQETVVVNGTTYAVVKYQYTETYQQQAQTSPTQGYSVPVYTETFVTTCDLIPSIDLNATNETKYTYSANPGTSSYLADDLTQLVSATIQ